MERDVLFLLVGIGAGAMLSTLFWWLATRQLNQASSELSRLITITLSGLEAAGIVKLTRDASGKITGYVVQVAGTARHTPVRGWGKPPTFPPGGEKKESDGPPGE